MSYGRRRDGYRRQLSCKGYSEAQHRARDSCTGYSSESSQAGSSGIVRESGLSAPRKPTPAEEQPRTNAPTLRLNAPRPRACPTVALSREHSKRRTFILTEEHNDACECVEMGLPPPEHPDFAGHSPFCQVHVCYAREVRAAATPTSSGKRMAWRMLRTCRAPASREHSNLV